MQQTTEETLWSMLEEAERGGGDQYSSRGAGHQREGSKKEVNIIPAGTGQHPGGQMTTEWRGVVWGGTGAGEGDAFRGLGC